MEQDDYVRLYRLFVVALLLLTGVPSAKGQAQTVGQWSTLSYTAPINPVHAALLHTGNVLIVSGSGNVPGNHNYKAALWNPQTGTIAVQTVPFDMFCNGTVILPDGRPFIMGGTEAYDPFFGLPNTATYDPATGTFTNQQNMAHGRWYPTATVLGDGRVLVYSGAISGEDNPAQTLDGSTNTTVEIYTVGSGWSQEYAASWTPPLYPRLHLLPNGDVFYSGPSTASAIFDTSSHVWSVDVADTNYSGNRGYGTSVLLPLTPDNNYDPRVMILGGGNPATDTTEIIDLGASTLTWQSSATMSQPRIEMNAVILPTGKILALGGSVDDEDGTTASLSADLFDPVTQQFSPAGAETYARLYHSVSLLLPDGTVWVAGSNPARGTYETHMEIYQPAYLFTTNSGGQTVPATRPTITSAPSSINYAEAFQVQTPNAANISSVVMMRNGSVTHAFDMDQRMVGLSFTAGSGTLSVIGPPNGNIAPPGYYMLFLVNSQGVPSVASFVLLSSSVSNPAPTVTTISPSSGPAGGGTPVTITGTGFQSGATVSLGGTAATGVTVVSSTSITATTAAHAAGAVNVVVTNTDSQSGTLPNGYTYNATTGGTISYVQGKSATLTSGTSIAITYTAAQTAGDLNVVAVMWGDTTRAISSVTDSKGNTYTLAVGLTKGTGLSSAIYYAKNIASGSNTVTVTFNGSAGWPNVNVLEYKGLDTVNPLDVKAAATGSGTTANSGSATTTSANELIVGMGNPSSVFTSAGSGFTNRMINAFGGISEDKIVSSTGSYNATATLTSGSWVMQMATFRASGQGGSNPAPTVTTISPTSGPASGGTPVTITGTGFLAGATVSLGGTAATGVTVVSSTSITATTAAHAAGTVNVVVTNTDSQTGTLASGYTYGNPKPTVTTISPTSGPASGGTPVTITGTGFLAGATVSLGGTAATGVTVVSSTSITATTAAHAAGTVNVVVTNTDSQTGTLTSGYTYGNPKPTVTTISPTSGPASGGTPVTITGTGFLAGATVSLGGTAATGVTVVSSTSITATTAAHAAGTVNVVVTNTDSQTGTLTNGYTYGNPKPTVTTISPTSGPASGGTPVTITGTGFLAGATVSLGGTAATGVTVVSSTSITATTAAHAAGTVNVVVTNTDSQTGTLTSGYTYGNPKPTVTTISPTSGPASGGTPVTITGTGFLAGATVSLGGTAATGVTVVSSTSITATTAAHAAGTVNVVVTNTDSQTGTLTSGYTYGNPKPTVTTISPTSGPASGGTPVTITGTGFLAGATVSLGGTAATGVTVVSSTSITATTAAHAAGTVNVVVTNTDSQTGTLTNGYTYNAATGGTIAYVQSKSATLTSGSSEAIAFSAAQTAGNLNVVAVMWGDTTSTVTSVTDSKGNTYALAVGPTKATGLTSAIYYAKNIAGGSNTVTVKFNQTAGWPNVNVLEYSGLDTANPLDVKAAATGTGTTANSGSVTTTSASELIVGAGNPTSVFTAAGSGFSNRIINSFGGISEDKIVSSTGSYNATATLTSGTWVMQMATFRASTP